MDVRAIFFDAGETLVYPHPSFPELVAEVLQAEGTRVDTEMVVEAMATFAERFTATIASEEHRLWSTTDERSRALWFGIYREFLAHLGIDDPGHRLAEALYRRFTDPASYRLHDDALPAIERLHGAGLSLGVISNFEAWLEGLLERLGVTRYFPVRVISGAEGVEKPDPRIFEIALERAGVAAAESVYVGDHPYFDVEASAAVGMLPVLIDRRSRHPEADGLRLTSLGDLPGALGLPA